MSDFVVIVMGDNILFGSCICPTNISYIDTPLEYFLSDYGLIIPLDFKSLLPFSLSGKLLHNRNKDDKAFLNIMSPINIEEHSKSVLLTPDGKLFSLSKYDIHQNQFFPNYIPSGNGIKWLIGTELESYDVLYGSIHLTDDIDEVFSHFCNIVPSYIVNSCKIYKISELSEWVKECLEKNEMLPFTGEIVIPSFNQKDIVNNIIT